MGLRVRSEQLFERVSHNAGTRLATDLLNLKKQKQRKDVRAYCFSQRVIDSWNGLAPETKKQPNPAAFKRRLKQII
jgi:hypothetical protein